MLGCEKGLHEKAGIGHAASRSSKVRRKLYKKRNSFCEKRRPTRQRDKHAYGVEDEEPAPGLELFLLHMTLRLLGFTGCQLVRRLRSIGYVAPALRRFRRPRAQLRPRRLAHDRRKCRGVWSPDIGRRSTHQGSLLHRRRAASGLRSDPISSHARFELPSGPKCFSNWGCGPNASLRTTECKP